MSTRMLIDARHPEETRVAVVKGNRVEEFDYESITKRQLRGNIYLAKVTRVEPSLQACFVDYGGNRHGFLAFSEIHPDYYQIPTEDREALLAEASDERREKDEQKAPQEQASKTTDAQVAEDDAEEDEVEQISGDDDYDEIRRDNNALLRRKYKIQEVIKRRQILLVQVVKEERGNKGAALTTYISLAGRYCVLMPNSPNGGGISRKISNAADRKKLKEALNTLDVPDGMGCIIRTAGQNRTKSEIRRDYDYLIRLWDGIRERTLGSIAPALIHEEADLIKRSIRDLYTREIDEVFVEGEEGYKAAKGFMKLLMPSHAKRVQNYKDRIPLFHRYQVETQLDAMYSPTVQLKSGGYIVINPTEALIAIDVNSGRSTKEHNIEETAYKTNLEAADEVARQLRLRDLAGLIVIDFIDMEERSNNRSVEKRLKEALKADRARIQVGRVSSFGLMEMSRQRLRPNLLEASMVACPTCAGIGIILSTETATLNILRNLEEEGIRDRSAQITISAPQSVAFYLLNQKRQSLSELEERYGYSILIEASDDLGDEPWRMDRVAKSDDQIGSQQREKTARSEEPDAFDAPVVFDAPDADVSTPSENEAKPDRPGEDDGDTQGRKRRRRRRRRGRRGRGGEDRQQEQEVTTSDASSGDEAEAPVTDGAPSEGKKKADADKPRRRSRGRRRKEEAAADPASASQPELDAGSEVRKAEAADKPEKVAAQQDDAQSAAIGTAETEVTEGEKPKRRRRVRRKKSAEAEGNSSVPADAASDTTETAVSLPKPDENAEEAKPEKKARRPRRRARPDSTEKGEQAKAGAEPAIAETQSKADNKEAAETSKAKPRGEQKATSDTETKETGETGKADTATRPKRRRPAKTAQKTEENEGQSASSQTTKTSERERPAPPLTETATASSSGSVERHIVSADGSGSHDGQSTKGQDKASAKRKKGWWQRALGR